MQSSIKLLVGLLLASQCAHCIRAIGTRSSRGYSGFSAAAQDKERDENRKAPEILEFMGVKQGDSVLDVIAMGGGISTFIRGWRLEDCLYAQ